VAPHADLEKLSRRFAEFSIKKTIMFDDEVDDEEFVECPAIYERHRTGCYYFGTHSGYDEAVTLCEHSKATLADVNIFNKRFIMDRITLLGGTDQINNDFHANLPPLPNEFT